MQIAKKIGILFVVSLLITATGGFSVYQHFCNCAGEMTSSFFKQENCDHHHAVETKSCCNVKETKSCCAAEPLKVEKPTCHQGNCCNTTSHFFKISDSFQQGIAKVTLKPVFIAEAIIYINLSEDIILAPTLKICCSDLPPPDSGKEIITALHQLKLDTYLV